MLLALRSSTPWVLTRDERGAVRVVVFPRSGGLGAWFILEPVRIATIEALAARATPADALATATLERLSRPGVPRERVARRTTSWHVYPFADRIEVSASPGHGLAWITVEIPLSAWKSALG